MGAKREPLGEGISRVCSPCPWVGVGGGGEEGENKKRKLNTGEKEQIISIKHST